MFVTIVTCICFACIAAPGLAPSACAAGAYTLGPHDVINVSVYAGGEEQVNVDLTVSDEGTVNFPFIGAVEAAGLSTSQLEKKVHAPLEKDYFVNPQVHIQTKGYHSLRFSISGAVKNPGNYEMQSATSLLDLIAKAGGVSPEGGTIAYILRDLPDEAQGAAPEPNGPDPIQINLLKLLDEGDMSHNVELVSGDSVYIPLSKGLDQATTKVYVSGEVKKPDVYDYQPGLTALSVCIMAGGFADFAAPNRTKIVRMEDGKQTIIKIDLEDVIEGKIEDVPLKPGDRLHVPESWM